MRGSKLRSAMRAKRAPQCCKARITTGLAFVEPCAGQRRGRGAALSYNGGGLHIPAMRGHVATPRGAARTKRRARLRTASIIGDD
jgi:hypothetical protein